MIASRMRNRHPPHPGLQWHEYDQSLALSIEARALEASKETFEFGDAVSSASGRAFGEPGAAR